MGRLWNTKTKLLSIFLLASTSLHSLAHKCLYKNRVTIRPNEFGTLRTGQFLLPTQGDLKKKCLIFFQKISRLWTFVILLFFKNLRGTVATLRRLLSHFLSKNIKTMKLCNSYYLLGTFNLMWTVNWIIELLWKNWSSKLSPIRWFVLCILLALPGVISQIREQMSGQRDLVLTLKSLAL